MRTRVVTPITAPDFSPATMDDILRLARSDNQVDRVAIDAEPASIEGEYDEALAVPDTVRKIVEAEAEGIDGVLIDCMGDPGLYPARERVDIPVVGPFQASGHVASLLGHRFSVATVLESVVPMFWAHAAVYGLKDHLASVRTVDIPVLELDADPERMVARLVEISTLAVTQDGADTIIFGCTGMTGVAERVAAGLRERGLNVPVVDPMPSALKVLEGLVDLHLSQSRRAFASPRPKAIPGFLDLAVS